MKLLLHCCCAPCALSCVKSLRSENIEPELFWYNPNIHPYTECKSRRDTLIEFAAKEKLTLEMLDNYGLKHFLNEVFSDMDNAGNKRCEKCYRMRLEKTAETAARKGCETFSTSLLISPHQNHDTLRRTGEEAAVKYGINFFYRDFRPLFREGQAAARAMGLYMQKYCGCIFSEEERYEKKQLAYCES